MDQDSFGTIPTSEILQALDVIGALEDIKPTLSKDYEGVLKQLEKIPVRIIYTLLDIQYTPTEEFLSCASYVQGVVDEILGISSNQVDRGCRK